MTLVKKPIVFIILDKGRTRKKDDNYPVRMIVKYGEKRAVYGLGLFLSSDDYDFVKGLSETMIRKKFKGEYQKTLINAQDKINLKLKDAQDIINSMQEFSIDLFKRKLFNLDDGYLIKSMQAKYDSLVKSGRAGYASTFQCTINSMKLFLGGERKKEDKSRRFFIEFDEKKDISLKDVDKGFLERYQDWFMSKKKSKNSIKQNSRTTVGIYLRNVRVIMYDAVAAGILKTEDLPFGKRQYKIPSSRARKLAYTGPEIYKIQSADILPMSREDKYRDLFMFSFHARGMNIKDIAKLKYKNIVNDRIEYVRAKTELKEIGDQETLNPPLTQELGRIIDKWGNKPAFPETYIFPILKPGMTPLEERSAIVNETSALNRVLKKIATVLEFEKKISSYTARHSYATILRNSGVSVDIISDTLGHSDTKVTQAYLASTTTDIDARITDILSNLNPVLDEGK